MTAVYHSHKDF